MIQVSIYWNGRYEHDCGMSMLLVYIRFEITSRLGGTGVGVSALSPLGAAPQTPVGLAHHRSRLQSRRRWSPAPRMCARRWAGRCSCAARCSEEAPSASPQPYGASKGSCSLCRPLSLPPQRPWTIPSCASTLSPATAVATMSAASPTMWARLPASSRSRVSAQSVPPHPAAPT